MTMFFNDNGSLAVALALGATVEAVELMEEWRSELEIASRSATSRISAGGVGSAAGVPSELLVGV